MSVWSWRKIVECSAEFYIDSMVHVQVGNDVSGFRLMFD